MADNNDRRQTMDPLTRFPLEVSLGIFKHLELEELLLNTRLTCRAWNEILYSQLAHLMVESYFLRIDLWGSSLNIPLHLRYGVGGYTIYAETTVVRPVLHMASAVYSPVSAGVTNKTVDRAFMSDWTWPELVKVDPSLPAFEDESWDGSGGVDAKAVLDLITYVDPTTTIPALDTITLDLVVSPIPEADTEVSQTCRVTCTFTPQELADWIVLCRLAQGYQTPEELKEGQKTNEKYRRNGVVGPHRARRDCARVHLFPNRQTGTRRWLGKCEG